LAAFGSFVAGAEPESDFVLEPELDDCLDGFEDFWPLGLTLTCTGAALCCCCG
jgi:hypothetical protein